MYCSIWLNSAKVNLLYLVQHGLTSSQPLLSGTCNMEVPKSFESQARYLNLTINWRKRRDHLFFRCSSFLFLSLSYGISEKHRHLVGSWVLVWTQAEGEFLLLSICSVPFLLALTVFLLMFFSCLLHRCWFKIKINTNILRFKWNLLQEFTSGASVSKIIPDFKKNQTTYFTCKIVIYQSESRSLVARCFSAHPYWDKLIDNFLLLMGDCWTQMFSTIYTGFCFPLSFIIVIITEQLPDLQSVYSNWPFSLGSLCISQFLLLIFPLEIKARVRSFKEGFLTST